MSISPVISRLISAVILLIVAQIATTTLGQENAKDLTELRYRIVSPEPVFYSDWSSLKDFKLSGSPTEDWVGQPEIQLMFKKLFSAIKEYQNDNPIDDQETNELLMQAPKLLRDCPATLHVTGYDPANPVWKDFTTVAAVKLGEHEDLAKKVIEKLLQTAKDDGETVQQHELDGSVMHSLPISGGGNRRAYFGIIEGNLVLSAGAIEIQQTLANLKSPAPELVKNNRASASVDRPFIEVYIDTAKLFDAGKKELPEGAFEAFKLEEIESMSMSVGLDQSGMVTSFFLKCPENPTGIVSAFTGKQIEKAHVADMPKDSISSAGASLQLVRLFQQIETTAKFSNGEEALADSLETLENLTNLKFSEEILDSFDGTFFAYQNLTNANVLSLRVKDKDQFAKRLSKCMKTIRIEAEAVEGGEFKEKDYKGYTIYSFSQPVYLGPSFSWCHADDQFYVGVSANVISGHLRRRGRKRGRLIDQARFNETFDMGQAKGWGNPIAFSHIDISTTMQMLVPLGRTFLGGQKIDGFDFTVDDVPSVEILANGVQANMIAVFRTPDGIQAIERSTVPGLSSISTSGILVGMLLPAVQQVRSAARRTVAMNNMRQLQLSILNYESAHGHLPASYSVDDAGKPLLSWRVHILPYLEEQKLYDKFHLDEPWDSPHNIELIDEMPEFFQNPNISVDSGKTTYLGIAGKNGAFPGPDGLKIGQVVDGTSNVVCLVDVNAERAVDWTKPADFDPADHEDLLNALGSNLVGSNVLVALVDGSTHTLTVSDDENLRQMMHRSDGEGKLKQE